MKELLEDLKESKERCLRAAVQCFEDDPKNPVEPTTWLELARKFQESYMALQPWVRTLTTDKVAESSAATLNHGRQAESQRVGSMSIERPTPEGIEALRQDLANMHNIEVER